MSEENKVAKFDHEVFGALEVIIYEEGYTFYANKVAKILGYKNSQDGRKHCKSMIKLNLGETHKLNLESNGQHGAFLIREGDVYRMVMKSKLKRAIEFQDWVCETVLPTLRKESMYIVDEEKVASGEMSEDELIFKAMTLMQTKVDRYKHEKETAVAESVRLQGVCATITDQFINDGQTAPKFCRKFNGVNVNQVQNYLCDKSMLLPKSKTGWSPTSYARDKYLTERTSEHFGITISTAVLTKEGAKWLYKKYLKGELPMKQTWDGKFSNEVFEV